MRLNETAFTTWRVLTWTGPAIMLLLGIPLLAIGFLPPPSPSENALQIAGRFQSQPDQIRLACAVMVVAFALWYLYITAFAAAIRRMERGIPVITYATIAFGGGSTVFFMFVPLIWGVAAFRPVLFDPQILLVLNDLVWFIFFFTAPQFAVWFLLVGAGILRDHNVPALYPRWVGYFNIFEGVLAFVPVVMIFFKTGPFAWNGLMIFWVPIGIFGAWFLVMTTMTLKMINRLQREATGEHEHSEVVATAPAEQTSAV